MTASKEQMKPTISSGEERMVATQDEMWASKEEMKVTVMPSGIFFSVVQQPAIGPRPPYWVSKST
jgi:hypothetical protein